MRFREFGGKAANICWSSSHWCIFVKGWGWKGGRAWVLWKSGQIAKMWEDNIGKRQRKRKERTGKEQKERHTHTKVSVCLHLCSSKSLLYFPRIGKEPGYTVGLQSNEAATFALVKTVLRPMHRQAGRPTEIHESNDERTVSASAQWDNHCYINIY